MAKAANDLAISQPVVSKTIADLEGTLGVRLLDRSRRGIEPTPFGRALLRRSFAAFDELREGIKEIEFLTKPTIGDVHVGALGAVAAGLLPTVMDKMHNRYPRFTTHVTPLFTSPAVYETLRQRAVDFILGRSRTRTRTGTHLGGSSRLMASLPFLRHRVMCRSTAAASTHSWSM